MRRIHNDGDAFVGGICHLEQGAAGRKYRGYEQEGPTITSHVLWLRLNPTRPMPRGNLSESMYQRSLYPQAHMK